MNANTGNDIPIEMRNLSPNKINATTKNTNETSIKSMNTHTNDSKQVPMKV